MPCDSSHLEASQLEVECSRLYLLIDEMKTGRHPDSSSREWRGYDPRAYNSPVLRSAADRLTAILCDLVKDDRDMSKRSLELQVWARDHLAIDAKKQQPRGDIVSRLRRWAHDIDAVSASDLMDEAASEIEFLRGRLAALESF